MKIMVTGGNGFIGSSFIKHLIEKNHKDLEIINVDKNYKPELQNYYSTNSVSTYNLNLSEKDTYFQLPTDITMIVHCAAQSGGWVSKQNPKLDVQDNVVATCLLVNWCKHLETFKKFIFTSSMAVNGEYHFDENLPKSNYGASKLAAEYYVKTLAIYGKIFQIVRLYPTYGFGQDMDNMHQGMVSIFLKQIMDTGKLILTGSKLRTRSIVHINDVVNLLYCLSYLETIKCHALFPYAFPKEYTMEEIANCIFKQLNLPINIIENEGFVEDQNHASISEKSLILHKEQPTIDLEEGIRLFLSKLQPKENKRYYKIIRVDLDGTLFHHKDNGRFDFLEAKPIQKNIDYINKLYDEGHMIILWTSRGQLANIDLTTETETQVKKAGIKYHKLCMDKPFFNQFFDDRACDLTDYLENKNE